MYSLRHTCEWCPHAEVPIAVWQLHRRGEQVLETILLKRRMWWQYILQIVMEVAGFYMRGNWVSKEGRHRCFLLSTKIYNCSYFFWNGCLFCDDICLNCALNKRKNYNRWRMLFSLVTLLSNTWTSACLYWESRKNKELLGQLPKSKLIHSTLPQQPLIPTKTLLIFKQIIRPLDLEIICKNFEYCY